MKNAVAMDEVEPSDRHRHPALDVGRHEDEGLVADDVLEVGCEKFEHEVEVALVREDRQQLQGDGRRLGQSGRSTQEAQPSAARARGGRESHLDHVVVPELAQKLDLADGRHVEPVLELTNLDLLYGNVAPGGDLLACSVHARERRAG
jgi:hypothetical protein